MCRLLFRQLPGLTLLLVAARATAQQPAPPAVEPAAESISLEALLDTVVTATLREQAAIDAPASITVVDAQLIRARGYRTLKQIMNDVPGFNDVSDRNEEIVAVRGVFTSTTNKILILVNGHRMNDLMLGRYNTDQYLGLSAVERVEFIRGPGSALYGTGALVGVVNVITRKGGELDGVEVSGRLGPYARQASVDWGRMLAGYDLHFNFSYLDSPGQKLDQPAGLDMPPEGQPPLPGRIYLGRYRENQSALITARGDQPALT
jgi:iron complex outermembrane receptor protein